MSNNINLTSMQTLHELPIRLDGKSIKKKREEIRNYFHQTYALYEKLFECF